MDLDRQPYEAVRAAVSNAQLPAKGGAILIGSALRAALGTKRQVGHVARECPNRVSRDVNHANLRIAFGSLVCLVHGSLTALVTQTSNSVTVNRRYNNIRRVRRSWKRPQHQHASGFRRTTSIPKFFHFSDN